VIRRLQAEHDEADDDHRPPIERRLASARIIARRLEQLADRARAGTLGDLAAFAADIGLADPGGDATHRPHPLSPPGRRCRRQDRP